MLRALESPAFGRQSSDLSTGGFKLNMRLKYLIGQFRTENNSIVLLRRQVLCGMPFLEWRERKSFFGLLGVSLLVCLSRMATSKAMACNLAWKWKHTFAPRFHIQHTFLIRTKKVFFTAMEEPKIGGSTNIVDLAPSDWTQLRVICATQSMLLDQKGSGVPRMQ